jgi:hypothetical protein
VDRGYRIHPENLSVEAADRTDPADSGLYECSLQRPKRIRVNPA